MTVENTGGAASSGADKTGAGGAENKSAPLTLDQITAAFDARIAPLQAEIASLKNGQNAAKRVAKKEEGARKAPDLSNADPEVRTAFEETQREMRTLREAEDARAKKEEDAALKGALKTEITNGRFANPDIMEGLLVKNLRRSTDDSNVILIDDGQKAVPLSQAVKDLGLRDIFRPASVGNGAGAQGDQGAGGSGGGSGKGVTAADIEKMTDAEFAAHNAKVKQGQVEFAD